MQYSEHDQFRDAVNDDGDVVHISSLDQPTIDESAVQLGRNLGIRPSTNKVTQAKTQKVTLVPNHEVFHGPQYGEEEGVGMPNGEPQYFQPPSELTGNQRDQLRRGSAMARRTIEELTSLSSVKLEVKKNTPPRSK